MVILTFGEVSQGPLEKVCNKTQGLGCPPTVQLCIPPQHTHNAALHSPRNVVEMYSETWFPDLLISDRCVSSRFSILLN